MKISELHKKVLELELECGDTIQLSYQNGSSSQVVFRSSLFKDENGHPMRQFSEFNYVHLTGLTWSYFGHGQDGNFDFDLDYVGIERWDPTSEEDIEKVKMIREDLESKTRNKYIS